MGNNQPRSTVCPLAVDHQQTESILTFTLVKYLGEGVSHSETNLQFQGKLDLMSTSLSAIFKHFLFSIKYKL